MPRQNPRLDPKNSRLATADQRRMVELLRYASFAEVGKALKVSRSAVGKWAVGDQVSPWNLRRVEELLAPAMAPDQVASEIRSLRQLVESLVGDPVAIAQQILVAAEGPRPDATSRAPARDASRRQKAGRKEAAGR